MTGTVYKIPQPSKLRKGFARYDMVVLIGVLSGIHRGLFKRYLVSAPTAELAEHEANKLIERMKAAEEHND